MIAAAIPTTLREIEESWSLDDLFDAHFALNALEISRYQSVARMRNKE